jgi:hypothetical protein
MGGPWDSQTWDSKKATFSSGSSHTAGDPQDVDNATFLSLDLGKHVGQRRGKGALENMQWSSGMPQQGSRKENTKERDRLRARGWTGTGDLLGSDPLWKTECSVV